jgi:hypothetical protein
VIKWRDRFAEHGLAGLDDEPRPGRPKTVDDSAIVAATLEPPRRRLGVTHWSSRLLGKHVEIGDATVARAWRRYHVQPWRRETFKADPAVASGAAGEGDPRPPPQRHGKAEFLDFLKTVAKACPRRELHVVLDNYHTHNTTRSTPG